MCGQRREAVDGGPRSRVERRDPGTARQQLRARAGSVEFRRGTLGQQHLNELQGLLLHGDVAARDVEPEL